MTVENQTIQKRVQSDGSTDTIPFSFKVQSADDFSLYLILRSTGVPVLLTGDGIDYSVELSDPDEDGGVVTLTSVATNLYDYLLFNDMDITQPADFPTEGSFNEVSVERALDRSCLINLIQQNSLNRALKLKIEDVLNVTDYGGLYIKAEPTATRQSKVLAWNADGDEIETSLSISEFQDLVDSTLEATTNAATSAASSASSAAISATSAATSATQAQNYSASYSATSTSSLAIATGTKVFAIQSGKLFAPGQQIIAASAANPANYMHGTVTTLVGTTLTTNIVDIGGSGTLADWNISISGTRGATGPAGPAGSGAGDMLAANNLNDVANTNTARTNLSAAKSANNSDITSLTGLTTALSVAQGGTGRQTIASKGVMIGAGTSGVNTVAPGTAGNVLTSDGTDWVSSASPTVAQASTVEIAAESAVAKYISPDRLKNAPGVAKAWGYFSIRTGGAISLIVNKGYNISSLTRSGSNPIINFINPMSDTNYCVLTSFDDSHAGSIIAARNTSNIQFSGSGTYDANLVYLNLTIFD